MKQWDEIAPVHKKFEWKRGVASHPPKPGGEEGVANMKRNVQRQASHISSRREIKKYSLQN